MFPGSWKPEEALPDSLMCTGLWDALALVIPELSPYDGTCSSRGRSQGRRTEAEKGRHLGVGMRVCQVESSWPNPERANRLLGYIFKAMNLM